MTAKTKTEVKQFGMSIQTSTLTVPPGSHVFSTLATYPQSVVCGVEYGDNDPNWKERLKRGEGVVTSLVSSDLRCVRNKFFTGKHVVKNVNSGVTTTRRLWGDAATICDQPGAASGISTGSADNIAKMVFIKKAIAAQQSLQGLVALGELRQTINLIRNPLSALRNAVDKLTGVAWKKRQKFGEKYKGTHEKTAVRSLMADTYLEWAFGAQPLVSDVLSGAEAAARILTYHPPQKFIKGVGTTREGSSLALKTIQGGNGARCIAKVFKRQEASVKYYGSVWTVVPGLGTVSGTLGIRLMDVIPAVWELIPYSFLVDYFTNAQEIINAACFPTSSLRWVARGCEQRNTNELVSAECSAQVGLFFGDQIQENNIAMDTGCETYRSDKVRSIYEGVFVPEVAFEIPSSPKKWLNIAALAATGKRFNGTNRL